MVFNAVLRMCPKHPLCAGHHARPWRGDWGWELWHSIDRIASLVDSTITVETKSARGALCGSPSKQDQSEDKRHIHPWRWNQGTQAWLLSGTRAQQSQLQIINSCRKWKGAIPAEEKMQDSRDGKLKPTTQQGVHSDAHLRLLAHTVGRSPFNKHCCDLLDRSQSYRPDLNAWPFTTRNEESDFISWFQKARAQYFKLLLIDHVFVVFVFLFLCILWITTQCCDVFI